MIYLWWSLFEPFWNNESWVIIAAKNYLTFYCFYYKHALFKKKKIILWKLILQTQLITESNFNLSSFAKKKKKSLWTCILYILLCRLSACLSTRWAGKTAILHQVAESHKIPGVWNIFKSQNNFKKTCCVSITPIWQYRSVQTKSISHHRCHLMFARVDPICLNIIYFVLICQLGQYFALKVIVCFKAV